MRQTLKGNPPETVVASIFLVAPIPLGKNSSVRQAVNVVANRSWDRLRRFRDTLVTSQHKMHSTWI